MPRLLQIDEARLETARLQFVGYHREHRQHRRHAVIRRIQQTSEDNSESQSEQLLNAVVHPAPEEALRCLILQRFHLFISFAVEVDPCVQDLVASSHPDGPR